MALTSSPDKTSFSSDFGKTGLIFIIDVRFASPPKADR